MPIKELEKRNSFVLFLTRHAKAFDRLSLYECVCVRASVRAKERDRKNIYIRVQDVKLDTPVEKVITSH